MEYSEGSSKGKVHRNIGLPQDTGTIPNKNSKLTNKKVEKEEQVKPKVSKRIGIRSSLSV